MVYSKHTPYYMLVPAVQGDKEDNTLSITAKGEVGLQQVAARPHQIWRMDKITKGTGDFIIRSMAPAVKEHPFTRNPASEGAPIVLTSRDHATRWDYKKLKDTDEDMRFFWVQNRDNLFYAKLWYWNYDAFRNRCFSRKVENAEHIKRSASYLLVPTLPLPVITKADCSVGTFGDLERIWYREVRLKPPPRDSEFALPQGTEVIITMPKEYQIGWFWNNGKVLKKGMGWTRPGFGDRTPLYHKDFWDGTEFWSKNGGKSVKDVNNKVAPARDHRIHTIQYWYEGISSPPVVIDFNNHQGLGCKATIENNGIAYW
ncbi:MULTISPECIES: hypothetical protein [Streptomyces]|uniref:hypothetical protein n=1 Tax=Streptomyces TaxID=1883 RepID=UPI00163BF634|nr:MULTISPECIES: hypothetical protein [Streptomyces]MBC2876951.1 hypothetical protein [Streptomyces sp. TYQ1024]UBI35977.1 hypothetical protein K7I03_05535 [Streptomyces mobaraensis]UKW28570.1 hypothetical protein MCU78_05530 [Streptomyces sp. TYQ1024]